MLLQAYKKDQPFMIIMNTQQKAHPLDLDINK